MKMETNNYLIISSDDITINNSINRIIKDSKFKDYELIKYDLTVNELSSVIEELNTYNFLSTNKIIVLNNALFIEESNYDKELKQINEYIDNYNPDNIFIMIASKKRSAKEVTSLIEKITLIDSDLSCEAIIKNNLEDFKMDNSAIKKLIEYSLNNNEKVLSELNKLKMYRIDSPNKLITLEDVENIVIKEYDLNVFDLVNAITKKDKKKAFSIYEKLIDNTDSSSLIGSIASKVKMLYSVKILRDEGLSMDSIAEKLDVKKGAVSYALEECDNFSTKKLIKLLKELCDLDFKSKSQNVDMDFLFKMFMLSI